MHELPGQPAHLPSKDPVWLVKDGDKKGIARGYAVMNIQRSPHELYALWRNVSLAPRWMERIVSAEETADGGQRWTLTTADSQDDTDAKTYSWTTKLVSEVPGQKLAWRSTGGDLEEAGEVTFRELPNGRGTEVLLVEEMRVPGGKVSSFLAGIADRSPEQTIFEDLRHFKQLAETGEIPTTEGQPHGPRGFVGSIKRRLYGENNPTPPGTREVA